MKVKRHTLLFGMNFGKSASAARRRLQTKSYSPPRRGRIALSANERIAEFLDFAIQAKFAYVNKLRQGGTAARRR